MADNYLEKRYEETLGANKPKVKRIGHTVDELLLKNRSTRGYKKAYVVSRHELERIAGVCTRIPSARNQQVLRFRLVTKESGADLVLSLVKMGAALPELHLPFPGTEPEAFIIVCSTVAENPMVDIDLGIAAQSMLLKAVEMGLNGLIVEAFNRDRLREALSLPYPPLMVIAIGKSAETIALTPIDQGESQAYYRRDGIHYVPKVRFEQLTI
ncbi:MAG: nitroreductase family protein [Bacteroidales bacterium]|nr:nitroreductase family protein [Bacteroidales bacterium]